MTEALNQIVHSPSVWAAFGSLALFWILLRIGDRQERRDAEERAERAD